jgi:hypothetical protein
LLSSFPFVALARDFVVFNPAQLKTWWVIFQPVTTQPTLSNAHDSVPQFLPYIRPALLSALQDVLPQFLFLQLYAVYSCSICKLADPHFL